MARGYKGRTFGQSMDDQNEVMAAALNVSSSSEVSIGVVTDLKRCLGIRRSEEGKATS